MEISSHDQIKTQNDINVQYSEKKDLLFQFYSDYNTNCNVH